jgi:hypothetical protein
MHFLVCEIKNWAKKGFVTVFHLCLFSLCFKYKMNEADRDEIVKVPGQACYKMSVVERMFII